MSDKKTSDKTSDKTVKLAEDIFKYMGVDKDEKCEHGLKFFQCMPCSH